MAGQRWSREEWEVMASASFVPVLVDSVSSSFRGRMTQVSSGATSLTRVTSDACSVRRPGGLIDWSEPETALISVQLSGTSRVVQQDRLASVGSGKVVVYSSSQPYELHFPVAADLAIVQVPAEQLGLRRTEVAQVVAHALETRDDPGVGSLARAVSRCWAPGASQGDVDLVLRTAPELVTHALRKRLGLRRRSYSREALLVALQGVIDAALDDPALDVAHLAAAVGVSVRTVHTAFSGVGAAPATAVRSARLERVKRLLVESRLLVGDIARASGFADVTTMTRAFRRDTGLTPTEFRRASREHVQGSGAATGDLDAGRRREPPGRS